MVILNIVENYSFWFDNDGAYIDIDFSTNSNSLTATVKNQSGTHLRGFNYLDLTIYTESDSRIGNISIDLDSGILSKNISIPSTEDIYVIIEYHGYDFDYSHGMEYNTYWSDSHFCYIYRKHYQYIFDPNGGYGERQTFYLPCYYVNEGGMGIYDFKAPVKESSIKQYENVVISFNANLVGAILTKTSQEVQTVEIITDSYELLGWSSSPNATEDEIELEAKDFSIYNTPDTTFYAVWANYSTQSTEHEYSDFTFPTTTECYASDYTLLGFHRTSQHVVPSYSPGSNRTAYSNTNYYAIWKPNNGFRIKLDTGQIIEQLYSDGTFNKLPIPTNSGYKFNGWEDNDHYLYDNSTPIKGTEQNMYLYARWEELKLTVNYYSNGATAHRKFSTKTWTELNPNENVLVNTHNFKSKQIYNDALSDYSGYDDLNTDIMRKRGYLPTQYWNTEPDGSGYSFFEKPKKAITGEEIALTLGINLNETGATSVNVYAQWKPQTEVYICYEGDKDTIYAGNFVIDDTISINNKGEISAPTFETRINNLAISENGIVAEVFKYGSPDFPYAAEEWNP